MDQSAEYEKDILSDVFNGTLNIQLSYNRLQYTPIRNNFVVAMCR